jgi:hypothetical protein
MSRIALWACAAGVVAVAGILAVRSWEVAPTVAGTAGSPRVAHSSFHVEVLNGCGVDGIARRVGVTLRQRGFDVMTMENAETFGYPESMVLDRVGKPEYARLVAEALGIPNHLQQKVADPFRIEEVTVIIGHDYRRLSLVEARGSSLSAAQ